MHKADTIRMSFECSKFLVDSKKQNNRLTIDLSANLHVAVFLPVEEAKIVGLA